MDKYWERCVDQIEKGQIENATIYALKTAVKLDVSQALIDRIMSISLKSYEKKVEAQMDECLKRAKLENAEALCLYYKKACSQDVLFNLMFVKIQSNLTMKDKAI